MSKKRVKKTKTKRSKFKPSRRSAPRTDIGIVSTIPFAPHSTYRDAFELGLGSSVANAGVLDNLGYDQNRLDTALGNLDGNNGIHLIVTLGGLHPALRAAAVVSRTPFVSLVGSTTDQNLTGAQQFWGAVDLQSVHYDPTRIYNLFLYGLILPNDACLLVNGKSAMYQEQVGNWPNGNIVHADIDQTIANPRQVIDDAFNGRINSITAGGWTGVVVSADPYFGMNAPDLVRIATHWASTVPARLVIYPTYDYHQLGAHQHRLYGPLLAQEYQRLGDKIANNRSGIEPGTQYSGT